MKITKEEVDAIFEAEDQAENPHQQNYVVALYKKVFPDWDDIKKIDGWPQAGEELALYLIGKARDFDRKHHPDVMAAGCWGLNVGWRADKSLKPWEVTDATCTVERG